ncbi:cAMP and cAMP-inhibited cGMP 3',5'-cyclic phosphodiesterase 10A-like [Ctenocephalides felis]|uniref:cAMP and cAMP-inhibited cGMP 3',5'-cyclic phosphodiesterase 10A-like n=1 Tax=Ctenocephalides felis TaxID=7515 RepID=UPI000E6E3297|nr:cAMP and cAMP-inhibited cGMP 3',5'-cyclic phosphodiesterase 10A-like [Ctenocephalides felis]
MTRRVIAPYLHVVRRGTAAQPEKKVAIYGKTFQEMLRKKPSVLIKDLSEYLSDFVDLPALLHDTADLLKFVTNSTERGKTIAAFVAATRNFIMTNDVLGDERFPEGVGWKGPTVKAVLCVPILTQEDECFAIVELYKESEEVYDDRDLQVVMGITGWMGAAIQQNQMRLILRKQQQLNDYLLEFTSKYFGDNVQIEQMISEIVNFAKTTLGGERGSFYVVHKDKNNNVVADLYDEALDASINKLLKRKRAVKFNKARHLAALTARAGKIINIRDTNTDPRFSTDYDIVTGQITRTILSAPIMTEENVLGVIQVMNKVKSEYFTNEDEKFISTFATYCALVLQYARINDAKTKGDSKNAMYREMLTYHMRPTVAEVKPFLSQPLLPTQPEGIMK